MMMAMLLHVGQRYDPLPRKSQIAVGDARTGGHVNVPKNSEPRERIMARSDSGYLPTENPCAQCGKRIAAPEWIEGERGRVSYLWHCRECDYRFEAVAFFEHPDDALAA